MKYKDENGEWVEIAVKASDTLPIGTQVAFGGSIAPINWLICDGSEVSRTTYADLFSVIGTSYGEGDGSTTFNLPDKRSRTSIGVDSRDTDFDAIGKKYGEKNHTLTIDEMPKHKPQAYSDNTNYAPIVDTGKSDSLFGLHFNTDLGYRASPGDFRTIGNDEPHNNVQPSEVDNWIIKAKQSVAVVAQVEHDLSSNSDINAPTIKAVNDAISVDIVTDGTPVKTGRKIDGKDEYVKRINLGGLTNAATKEVKHGLDYDKVDFIGFDLTAKDPISKITQFIPTVGSSTQSEFNIRLWIAGENVVIHPQSNRTSYTETYMNLRFTYK